MRRSLKIHPAGRIFTRISSHVTDEFACPFPRNLDRLTRLPRLTQNIVQLCRIVSPTSEESKSAGFACPTQDGDDLTVGDLEVG